MTKNRIKWPIIAVAKIVAPNDESMGHVIFTQESAFGGYRVDVKLVNVFPEGAHGLHVHESDDMSNGCESMGPHFNPFNQVHGGRTGHARHVGDFGNVYSDNQGFVDESFHVEGMLLGDYGIAGRGLVLHASYDDTGHGGNMESLKTGNSGQRIGCGAIRLLR